MPRSDPERRRVDPHETGLPGSPCPPAARGQRSRAQVPPPLHLLRGGCGGTAGAVLSPPFRSERPTSQQTRLPEISPCPPAADAGRSPRVSRPDTQPPAGQSRLAGPALPREEVRAPANHRAGRGAGSGRTARGASGNPAAGAPVGLTVRTGHARAGAGARGGVSRGRERAGEGLGGVWRPKEAVLVIFLGRSPRGCDCRGRDDRRALRKQNMGHVVCAKRRRVRGGKPRG